MAYYLHYYHPTRTLGLVAGGFAVADEAEGRHYLADYAAQGYRAELWRGDELLASTAPASLAYCWPADLPA